LFLAQSQASQGNGLKAAGNCYDQLEANLHTEVNYPGWELPIDNFYCNDTNIVQIYCQCK
jgi:hypothetical protein